MASLLVFLLLVITSLRTSRGVSLPVQLGGCFRWEAALDEETGTASSKEASNVPVLSKLHELVNHTEDSELLRLTEDLLRTYPTWLCTFPVTLGLFEAVPVNQNRGYEIRLRLLGIPLLIFGQIQGQRLTYRQNELQICQCTAELPIVGGLLSLAPPGATKNRMNGRGSLLFSLKKSQGLVFHGNNQERRIEHSSCQCSLSSALFGYRPWLAGHPPVFPMRKWTYLSTQSIIHAYIMWRFHRFAWNPKICRAAAATARER